MDIYYDAQSTPLQSKTRTADSDSEFEPDEGMSEPDEGLEEESQYNDDDRNPRLSHRRAQSRGNFSPRNSEHSDTPPPTTAVYEEQTRTRAPTSASQRSITGKIAVDLRTNVSNSGSTPSRGRADSRANAVPSSSRQGKSIIILRGNPQVLQQTDCMTLGMQMDLDEPLQRETAGLKRKSSMTHGYSQVTQETDAMALDELEGSTTHTNNSKRLRHHDSKSKKTTNVLVVIELFPNGFHFV